MSVSINIIRLPHSDGLALPGYQTSGSAGMDLQAAVPVEECLELLPGERTLVPTGLVFEIPSGYEAQIRPRSGLAYKNGITCLNTPGTIDSDYRGEVHILLINHGKDPFKIERGMRVAQMVVAPVTRAVIREATLAESTERGEGGFGSTGA